MAGGVKPPGGSTYTSSTPPTEDTPPSPTINPKPQIPRGTGKVPKSCLKTRSVKQTPATTPQVNQQAREKIELKNESQNLVAQLEHLMAQQQFIACKAALLEAIASPETLPEDFTVVYIDENGQEVTVIPPDTQLQDSPEQETELRNQLKAQVYQLDELLTDEETDEINQAISTAAESLAVCSEQLAARGAEPFSMPNAPQRVVLDAKFLAAPAQQVPLPEEEVFLLDQQPVTQTPKKARFDEKQFSDQWIEFYSDPTTKIPGQFYTLNKIRQFSDDQLEHTHDYIQLLFPNKHISDHNLEAPRLTSELAQTIRETRPLTEEALKSVDQMLGFWGLERTGNKVTVKPQEVARHQKWNGRFDHNHQRITRMLNFLMECGQSRLARNIEQAMQSHRMALQQGEISFWAKAVGREPGASRAPATSPAPPSEPVPAPQPAPVHKVHHYSEYVAAYPYDNCQHHDRIDFYYPAQPGFVFTNFYQPQHPITIDGESWPTTEHYYQACKFNKGSPEWKAIQALPTADAVYKYIYPNRPHSFAPIKLHLTESQWLAKRDEVMMTALRAKAQHVPEFRKALQDSGDKLLFEVSPKDSYWGTGKDRKTQKTGKNVLGSMLMQIRDEIKAGAL